MKSKINFAISKINTLDFKIGLQYHSEVSQVLPDIEKNMVLLVFNENLNCALKFYNTILHHSQ